MRLLILVLLLTSSVLAQIGPNPANNVNTWRVEQVYVLGQAVIRNGVSYVSLVNNNVAFDPSGSPGQWGTVFASSASSTGCSGTENVTYSATPTFSTATCTSRIVLTGNITSFTLAAGTEAQRKCIDIVQGTGAYTVAGPTNVAGLFSVGTNSAKRNVQCFVYFGSDSSWLADTPGVINQ